MPLPEKLVRQFLASAIPNGFNELVEKNQRTIIYINIKTLNNYNTIHFIVQDRYKVTNFLVENM